MISYFLLFSGLTGQFCFMFCQPRSFMEQPIAGGSSAVECRSGFARMAAVGSCQLGAQLAASLGCRPRCFGLSTWPTWASPQHSSQGTTRARTRMQELTKRLLPSITLADILLTRTSESTGVRPHNGMTAGKRGSLGATNDPANRKGKGTKTEP